MVVPASSGILLMPAKSEVSPANQIAPAVERTR
jgi:hypothetical protein